MKSLSCSPKVRGLRRIIQRRCGWAPLPGRRTQERPRSLCGGLRQGGGTGTSRPGDACGLRRGWRGTLQGRKKQGRARESEQKHSERQSCARPREKYEAGTFPWRPSSHPATTASHAPSRTAPKPRCLALPSTGGCSEAAGARETRCDKARGAQQTAASTQCV